MDSALLTQGPAIVYAFENAVDVEVGYTKGGVRVDNDTKTMALMADQLGSTPANKIVTGVETKLFIPLAEWSLTALRRACANAVPLQDDTDAAKKIVEIRPRAGLSLLSLAKKWTIKPIDPLTGVETTNQKNWIIAWKAAPDEGTLSLIFATEEQRIIAVTLYCFPDLTVPSKPKTLTFGGETVSDANESGF